MEEKRMEKDLKKSALPDEEMEGVNGGGIPVPDLYAGLDLAALCEEPIRLASEAQLLLAKLNDEFLEMEEERRKRKYGSYVKQ